VGSIYFFDVARLPTPVDCCLFGTVEPDDGEIPLARHSRKPVGLFARRQ
jgi:hypothetical protein